MNQPPRRGPEHSRDREFTAVLEDLRSQFRVFGEGLDDVRNRLGRVEVKLENIDKRLETVEDYVQFLKLAFPTLATKDDLLRFERRITRLETTR